MAAQMTARTPPGIDPAVQVTEDKLRGQYRDWRRTLHRAKDYRVKVLRAMAEDGHVEAAEMLNDPPRAYKAVRCKDCAGCLLMAAEKACGKCQGCQQGRGCEEHHRRCATWARNANTFHGGSTITAASSQFDLLSGDLAKYEEIIIRLQDIDIELEDTLDALPRRSELKANPRFLQSAREKDLDDERQHVAKIAVMLRRHAELDDEDVEDFLALQPEGVSDPQLTGTQTARELIGMFGDTAAVLQGGAGGDQDLEREGDAQASLPGGDELFPGGESDDYVPWDTPVVSEPASSSTMATMTSPNTTVSWAAAVSTAPTTFTTASQTRPEPSHGGPVRSEVRFTFQTPLPPPPSSHLGTSIDQLHWRSKGSRPHDCPLRRKTAHARRPRPGQETVSVE